MTWVDVPCCEHCWIRREGTWEIADEGFEYLAALRAPVRMVNPTPDGEFRVEICHFCAELTIIGIYVRTNEPAYQRVDRGRG